MSDTALQLGQFQDPYTYENLHGEIPKEYSDIDSIWGKIGTGLGFVDRAGYEEWQKQRDRDYERASINSARAWEEYLDSTKFQRVRADLEKAGLNPWLALQSGVSASASGSSSSTGGSHSAKGSSDNLAKDLALSLMAIAKLFAALG